MFPLNRKKQIRLNHAAYLHRTVSRAHQTVWETALYYNLSGFSVVNRQAWCRKITIVRIWEYRRWIIKDFPAFFWNSLNIIETKYGQIRNISAIKIKLAASSSLDPNRKFEDLPPKMASASWIFGKIWIRVTRWNEFKSIQPGLVITSFLARWMNQLLAPLH